MTESLDDLIKRDKKLGRVRKPNNFTGIGGRGAPLAGRGRGGGQAANGARNVPKINRRNNQGGITK